MHPVDPVQLSSYYDGALEPGETSMVKEHLAVCATCRDRLASYACLGDAMRAEEESPVPTSLDRRMAALLQGEARVAMAPVGLPGGRDEDLGSQARPPGLFSGLLRYLQPPTGTGPGGSGPGDSQPRPHSLLQASLVAVLLIVILVSSLLFGFPFGDRVGPAVAVAYPCDDPAVCAVAVRFDGPIDRSRVEQSLRINPPVPVIVTWQGDTLLVRPTEPLQPTARYTLSVQPMGSTSSATPVALHFVAGAAGSPVAMATGVVSTPIPPTTPPGPPTVAATPTAAATPTPLPPTPTPTATLCAVQPVRGFGQLYSSQPAVALQLGCALVPERGVEMAAQPFEGGKLLWRGDRKEIIALLEGGKWQSYSDTFDGTETATAGPGEPIRGFGKMWREQDELRAALGTAMAPERSIHAVVEEFERGLMIWTEDRNIYALYDDGTWERHDDTFVDPTATPTGTAGAGATPETSGSLTPVVIVRSPTTISTPAPSVSASPGEPTAVPGKTPVPSDCALRPIRGFGVVYDQNPIVAARLRCAHTNEVGIQVGRQVFERGVMIWRSDAREIIALRSDGTWSSHEDTWGAGEALSEVDDVPASRLAPQRGFGKLWRQEPELREALGWATAEEEPLSGAVQEFAGGWMLWTGDRVIYVLYSDGVWQSFVDTFVDPTATPQ